MPAHTPDEPRPIERLSHRRTQRRPADIALLLLKALLLHQSSDHRIHREPQRISREITASDFYACDYNEQKGLPLQLRVSSLARKQAYLSS